MLPACGDSPGGPARLRDGGPVSVSFQDGQLPATSYAGARDTMLDGESPGAKNGADTSLSVEEDSRKVALLAWDLAGSIPATAHVESVSLTLEVSDRSSQSFSLYTAKRAWSEGQATWKEAAAGSPWQSGGARGANDRGSEPLASFSAPDTGSRTVSFNAAGVALVQKWVEDPGSNHGLVLDGPATDNRLEFRSNEYATKPKRPKLTVVWTDGGAVDGGTSTTDSAETASDETGVVELDPTPGSYKQSCDGSFGIALDAGHFVDGNDEDQVLRVYERGASASAKHAVDISALLGLSSDDEVDLEDAARIGDRIYIVSSHGRDKNGDLERMRYRFFAVDVSGTAPAVSFSAVGFTTTLLDEMLTSSNWLAPNASVISALDAAADLDDPSDADLAPKLDGINIEGLAWLPTAERPGQLVLGFRNPTHGGAALLVTLLNADAVLAGAKPRFGEAILLDLGGLRVRGMSWSPTHAAALILAGPGDGSAGPFRLYRWDGASDVPELVTTIADSPSGSAPEAVVVYPGAHDVQILFDQGEHPISGTDCKDSPTSSQFFSDVIVHVP